MPSASVAPVRGPLKFGERVLVLTISLLATAVTVSWGFHAKYICGGPSFTDAGRSTGFPAGPRGSIVPCYSDLIELWSSRGLGDHVLPYVHGGIDANGTLFGGVVEYPVLSGMLMWLGAIGTDNDLEFFVHSALIMAPFAFVTTVLLALMTRWWVLLWAATPALILYAFHNWELPVVFTSVAAIAVMAYGRSAHPATGAPRLSIRTSAVVASVLLAVGFSLKIYPGLFVIPLAIYVLTADGRGRRALDWAGAAWVAGAAIVTVVVTQAPFMIAGYDGWKAALDFQGERRADATTNSLWYWGVRFLTGGQTQAYRSIVEVASPLLIVVGVAVALWLGQRRLQRDGAYPWLPVAAAMLAAFMLFHKVHSPQYTLWILPFFAMLRIRWWIIAVYLVADFVMDASVFRFLHMVRVGDDDVRWPTVAVASTSWIHGLLLLALIVVFARAKVREPLASYLAGRAPQPGPLTRLAAADTADARVWLGTPVLSRGSVTLRPLRPTDAAALAALVDDVDLPLYRWTGPLPRTEADAAAWIRAANTSPSRVAFAVLHDDRLVGTTSFYDVDAANSTVAVGYTFYGADAMGTVVNPTAKLLLLDYAFDECAAVRVVWHTHEQNARSRAAIARLGAEFEGLLRKHRRFGSGWRTTAQFAMVDDDWPRHRESLAARAD